MFDPSFMRILHFHKKIYFIHVSAPEFGREEQVTGK
jgi:hypothetical protein